MFFRRKVSLFLSISSAICILGTALTSAKADTGVQPEEYTYNEIIRASVASDGTEGNSKSEKPAISDDGQRIVFISLADNLVSSDQDGGYDIFLYDHQSKELRLITTTGSEDYSDSSISGNGQFISYKSEVCSGTYVMITSCSSELSLYDSDSEQLTIIDTGYYNLGGYVDVAYPSISYNGRFVAYQYRNPDTVQIYLKDLLLDLTSIVSVDSVGTLGNNESLSPSISASGRYVAFSSYSTNLVSDDTNGVQDVFVYDTQTGITTRISVSSTGEEGNGASGSPSISSDGRYIAFESVSSNLVSDESNGCKDIFVHDTQTGNTIRVSVASDGTQADSGSSSASISGNGQSVAFSSGATNLVSGDDNGLNDIFVN